MTIDVEGFVAWLRDQGTPEPNLEVYRRGVEVLASHSSVDAALRAEQAAGASERRLNNLREVASQLANFRASRPRPVPVPDSFSPPSDDGPPLELALDLDRAPPRIDRSTAPTVSDRPLPARRPAPEPPRRGCECRERKDTYVDNDFGVWAKLAAGIAGIGGLVLVRFIGVFGAATIALAALSLGGLATTLSVCFRCEGCRRSVKDLDADERATLWKARGLLLVVSIGLVLATLVCAYLFLLALSDQEQQQAPQF